MLGWQNISGHYAYDTPVVLLYVGGLDPNPLFEMGQRDDVGADCGGWGRMFIQARIEKAE